MCYITLLFYFPSNVFFMKKARNNQEKILAMKRALNPNSQ